jgi:thiol-disulfide isomerase/thioredoxin
MQFGRILSAVVSGIVALQASAGPGQEELSDPQVSAQTTESNVDARSPAPPIAAPPIAAPPIAVPSIAVPSGIRCRLVWKNGDSLPGHLQGVENGFLTWQSPLFTRPARINVEALGSIEFLSDTGEEPSEAFRVMLRNGDSFRAELVAIDDAALTLQSKRHGTLRMSRDRVRELRRMNNPDVLFLGPAGLHDWETLSQGEPFERWRSTPDGHLGTTGWLAELFRKLKMPDQVEIEIELQSTGRPRFLIGFDDNPDESVRLETWDDEIYALAGQELKPVLTIEPDNHRIKLRLYWNRKTGHLAVYSHAGRRLQEITGAVPPEGESGLYLRNKGTQLTVEHVRVSRWNGGPPREIIAGAGTRIQTLSGDTLYGTVTLGDAAADVVTLKTESGTQDVAVSTIERLHFADDIYDAENTDPVRLHFADGSVLTGRLAGLSDGNFLLACKGSDQIVRAPLRLISRVTIDQTGGAGTIANVDRPQVLPVRPVDPEKPLSDVPTVAAVAAATEGDARLFTDAGILAGTLAVGDTPNDVIQWRLNGAIDSVPLAPDSVARIVRNDGLVKSNIAKAVGNQIKHGIDVSMFPDLLFLTTHDVLPCRIRGIDEKSVYLTSSVSDVTELGHEWVKAVEFGGANSMRRTSFKAAEWEITNLGGTMTHEVDSISFSHSGRIHHPRLFPADEISFRLSWAPTSNVVVALYFKHVFDTPLRTRPTVQFACYRNQLAVVNAAGTMVRQPSDTHHDPLNPSANIRVINHEGMFRIEIDGETVYSARVNDSDLSGRAITINVINTVQNVRLGGFRVAGGNVAIDGQPEPQKFLKISDFHVGFKGLGFAKHVIDAELRAQALTVPRFRRDNGATHIVVARNSDLLRGKLKSIDDRQVLFESLSEPVAIPRDRVGAIVWLHPELTDKAAPIPAWNAATPVVHASMRNEMSIVLQPDGSKDGQLAGSSPILGRCSIPLNEIRELLLGRSAETRVKAAYADWESMAAREPDFPGDEGGGSDSSFTSLLTGKPAPDFEAPTLAGPPLKLSDLRGKVVVIDFWATWCGPCVRWMPELDRIVQTVGFDKVELLAINQQETSVLIRDFMLTQAMKGRVLLDGNGTVSRKYGVETLPQTLVIDKEGTLVWHAVGYSRNTGPSLRKVLADLLNEDDPANEDDAAKNGEVSNDGDAAKNGDVSK